MKKVTIISCIAFLISIGLIYAGNTNVSNYVITPSTNSQVAAGENLGRKGVTFTNTDPTYPLYIATEPITADTYDSVGALAIPPNTIHTDDFYVYKSTWYVCGATTAVTGELTVSEKE